MRGFRAWLRAAIGGSKALEPVSSPAELPARPHAPRSFAEGNNTFAFAMYRQLLRSRGNLFLSPFSVRTALSMAYAGAVGETAEQIGHALQHAPGDETLHLSFAEIIQRLNAAGGGAYEMKVANSLWGQEGAPLLANFVDHISRHYQGEMNAVDFRRDVERARATINRWVENKTRDRIRNLIPDSRVLTDARLILVNAVYFKGKWVLKFDEDATSEQPFYLEGGGTVRAQLMFQYEEIRYMAGRDFQAVDLDYRGGHLSMLVLLPNDKMGLRALEGRLSAPMLHDCVEQLREQDVALYLPRFKMTWGADVGPHLQALGMKTAFTLRADFSGINGCKPPDEEFLFISAILHKAFVDANEEGTEAAASTALVATLGKASPLRPFPVFRADHPFLFAIRDRPSGTILFLGRVADPTRDS